MTSFPEMWEVGLVCCPAQRPNFHDEQQHGLIAGLVWNTATRKCMQLAGSKTDQNPPATSRHIVPCQLGKQSEEPMASRARRGGWIGGNLPVLP